MSPSRDDVIAVDPALLKRFMLDDLYTRTQALMSQPLPDAVEQLLGSGPAPADAQVARAGYLTRVVERDRFEPAREAMPWLTELLAAQNHDVRRLAAGLAAAEPPGKPAPNDPRARTWQVPGPGGHVRYFLAIHWSGRDEQRRRSWLYGFFARCCEETIGREPPLSGEAAAVRRARECRDQLD